MLEKSEMYNNEFQHLNSEMTNEETYKETVYHSDKKTFVPIQAK